MIYLFLSIIASTLIAVVIRRNEDRGLDRPAVMLFNYLTATGLSLFFLEPGHLVSRVPRLVPLGLISGFLFVTAFLVYMKAVRHLGLTIPVTVTRLAVVIPVLGSLFIFSERVSRYQTLGLVLATTAIYLFSWRRGNTGRREPGSNLFLPVLLFLCMGSGDFSLKVFQELYSPDDMMSFICIVFAVSSVYTLILVVMKNVRMNTKIVLGGFLLGIPNFTSAYFILKLLQVFPGSIAFPLNNIGIIVLSMAIGYLFWQERFHRRTWFAICTAAVAVFLLNAGSR